MTETLYQDFSRTGHRLPFETPYFERRRRLARAVLTCVLEPDGPLPPALLARAVDEIRSVFSEPSWALPAHVVDLSGKNENNIDLFAAETANLFGEAIDLMAGQLPGELVDAIDQRLKATVFANYLNRDFWWFGNRGNWNAVCHQGVLGAALARVDDAEMLTDLFAAALPRLRTFLSGFGEDGSTSEGPAYWSYGFGRFCELNRQLEQRTGGAFSLMHADPHVAAIARFGPIMTLSHGNCVNFADCAAQRAIQPQLLNYLGQRLGDAGILHNAEVEWRRTLPQPLALNELREDLFHLARRLLAAPSTLPAAAVEPDSDVLLENVAVVVSRFRDDAGRHWEFAAKAGHNDELHNHNDVGSFLLNIDGRRAIVEIGAPEYVKAFFNDQRYTFLAARSLGHSVPLINGCEQPTGLQVRGAIVSHLFTRDRVSIEMDLTAAYPRAAKCVRCIRRFEIDKRTGQLDVRDTFDFEDDYSTAESALMIDVPVEENAGVVKLPGLGVRVVPAVGTRVGEIQSHAYNTHGGEPATVNRIALRPLGPGRQVTVGFTVSVDDAL